jgi:hypothetical protein
MWKRSLLFLTGLALAPIQAGCGQSFTAPLDDIRAIVINSLGEDLSLIHVGDPPTVTKSAVTLGSAPNQILVRGQEAIGVSSTSNSIQVIDIEKWAVIREYSVGAGCNPYMLALDHENMLLVTCFLSNELLRVDPEADLAASPVLDRTPMPAGADLKPFDPQIQSHARPQGVAVVGHKAYVTLSNLGDDWSPAGPGMVVVVDVAAWTQDKIIELSKTNPATAYNPFSKNDLIYVPCSGNYDGTGVVEVLDTTSDSIVRTVETGGAPGRMWVDENDIAWVGDQLDGQVLKFDAETYQGLDSVMLCPADYENEIYDFISDVATDGRGNVYAACFATDAVHIFPAEGGSKPEVVEVGDGPQALLVVQR